MSQLNASFMTYESKYEVQRTNNFRFVIDLSEITNATGSNSGEIIELACSATGLPSTSNDPIEVDYGNSQVKVAGKATSDHIEVTVNDFIEPDVEAILYAWRRSQDDNC